MEKKRAMAILSNTLIFDRKVECDFCGKKEVVAICNYGTSHYNRLICPDCAERISRYEKTMFDVNTHWYSEETIEEAKEALENEENTNIEI